MALFRPHPENPHNKIRTKKTGETAGETSNSQQASSSQATQVETATELPKTGFDPNNR